MTDNRRPANAHTTPTWIFVASNKFSPQIITHKLLSDLDSPRFALYSAHTHSPPTPTNKTREFFHEIARVHKCEKIAQYICLHQIAFTIQFDASDGFNRARFSRMILEHIYYIFCARCAMLIAHSLVVSGSVGVPFWWPAIRGNTTIQSMWLLWKKP